MKQMEDFNKKLIDLISKDFRVILKAEQLLEFKKADVAVEKLFADNVAGFFVNHKLEKDSQLNNIYDTGKDLIFVKEDGLQPFKANSNVTKTMLHELAHATGIETMLNRPYVTDLSNRNIYTASYEEALAETVAYKLWRQMPFYYEDELLESYSLDYIDKHAKNASTYHMFTYGESIYISLIKDAIKIMDFMKQKWLNRLL